MGGKCIAGPPVADGLRADMQEPRGHRGAAEGVHYVGYGTHCVGFHIWFTALCGTGFAAAEFALSLAITAIVK
jgi:hypothetical protein